MRTRRLVATALVAALCAPTAWLRSEVRSGPPNAITLEQLSGSRELSASGWSLEGIWHIDGEGLMFGGYSAMLPLGEDTLRAFSDRGTRFTFTEPDRASRVRTIARQPVETGRGHDLWDIESATRDPVTGNYWLGFENVHTVHRFTIASDAHGLRDLDREVDWKVNSGAEAMVRLADGRFVILPEGAAEGLVFATDPVEGAEAESFAFRNPAPGFAVTDMAQLPDGRVLLLMRNLDFGIGGWPPFESKLVIGDPPRAGQEQPWSPALALDLAGIVPRENYEALALRPRADGSVTVWLMSDDNLAALQRTLLVKLRFDPSAADAETFGDGK
ncbi:esterase-like activity of phytase family protein [Erythrobacter sp. JK5]|uniref:esterase-like activity of phytase family protein n=1 Tax=Erythrobacter sp. JK5 TaxID=2829500 RepID=UPI001BAA5CB4|nr:esterase-like activity of phytase family protein [Erythrobacter sp. JK5]QUL37220.1 esterase-like activity of phytase family protein [Erythrobacter sp. JK5]